MTATVTKESLAARIAELESGARSLKEDYTLAAYKMLLAAMDAEPVAYIPESQLNLLERAVMVEADLSKRQRFDEIPLYRHARPAPVVTECFRNAVSALESLYRNGQKQGWHERYTTDMAYASGVLNACRAVMLNQK